MYPAASHFVYMLGAFIDRIVLDGSRLRRASPLDCDRAFTRDGAGLPWNVRYLKEIQEDNYREWIRHVRTVLPELEDIRVVEREDDRHAYLVLRYENGVEVPSWMTSDGTLKLLALTLFAYLPVADAYPSDRRFLHETILIEEPEDGVHPLALDAIYDSLSSVYHGQVLVTTHSPTFLGLANPEEVLCFGRTPDGHSGRRSGDRSPAPERLAWNGGHESPVRQGRNRMIRPVENRRLVVLVPDADIEQCMRGLLIRTDTLEDCTRGVRSHAAREQGQRVQSAGRAPPAAVLEFLSLRAGRVRPRWLWKPTFSAGHPAGSRARSDAQRLERTVRRRS